MALAASLHRRLLVPCTALTPAAGFRGRVITSRKGLWKGGPFKALTEGLSRSGGRNAQGGITVRHRGGGHRKVYRQVRHWAWLADGQGRGQQ